MEGLMKVLKMIKIKIKDKSSYIETDIKCKNYNVIEVITLLTKSISILKDNFELSSEEICKLVKDYRKNYKEIS